MRFFRSDVATYEQVRVALDDAWGHVAPTTCIEPAATAPRDSQGRVVLAVNDEFCKYSVAAEMLPQLLSSGAVEEIAESEYQAAIQTPDPLQG